jgi:hypothetical protein
MDALSGAFKSATYARSKANLIKNQGASGMAKHKDFF